MDVLLDRGQRFLAVRANIVLEVDLENLVFLWNSYVEKLRKLQTSLVSSYGAKEDETKPTVVIQEKSFTVTSTPNFAAVSFGSPSLEKKQTGKEEKSIELKDNDSNSSEGSSSVDVSPDISFQDSGTLTLEDLKTTTTALDISELVQEKSVKPAQEKLSDTAVLGNAEVKLETEQDIYQKSRDEERDVGDNGSVFAPEIMSNLTTESSYSGLVPPDQSGASKMEFKVHESHTGVINPDSTVCRDTDRKDLHDIRLASSGDCPPSPATSEKEGMICSGLSDEMVSQGMETSATFDSLTGKVTDQVPKSEAFSTLEMKRRRGLLEAPVTNISNQSSRSESPLSLDSSRSETPTGTLKRAERQNELWRAIGSIDTFLMDKDIIEACKVSFSLWSLLFFK